MCLNKIDSKIKVRAGYGWQVFKSINGKLYPIYYGTDPQKENTLQYSNQNRIETISSDVPLKKLSDAFCKPVLDLEDAQVPYTSGYHIFLRKSDADLYSNGFRNVVVRKVSFYGVTDKGYQNFMRIVDGETTYVHAPCVVAKARTINRG